MPEATFVHGEYRTMDHTPAAGAVDAGDMVLIGSVTANTAGTGALLAVAHHDIANGTLGALAIGRGVYDCMVASNYAAGTKVYKPSGNAILTSTGTNNALFGVTLEAAAAANAVVQCLHQPVP